MSILSRRRQAVEDVIETTFVTEPSGRIVATTTLNGSAEEYTRRAMQASQDYGSNLLGMIMDCAPDLHKIHIRSVGSNNGREVVIIFEGGEQITFTPRVTRRGA